MTSAATQRRAHLRKWWLLYFAGAIAIGIAAAYFLFFTPESADELTLGQADTAIAVDASDLSGAWSPADESIAGYRVREQLAMLPAPSDAVGRTSDVGGTIQIEDKRGQITSLSGSVIEVDLTTLESDESRRDDRIRTSGLETTRFPNATFELTDDVVVPESIREGETVKVNAHGELTLHGATQSVTVPLEVRLSGDRVEVLGNLEIPMADYDIDVSSFGGFVSVEDSGTIEFVLSLALKSDG